MSEPVKRWNAIQALTKSSLKRNDSMAESNSTPELRPCIKCGASDRDKRGTCIPCKREYQRKYIRENRDKILSPDGKLRSRYDEKRKAYSAAYRAANKEKIKATQLKYREANREDARIRSMNYLNANRDAINAKARANYDPKTSWEKLNPERAKAYRKAYVASVRHKRAAYEQNRRAKKAAGGELPVDIVQKLLELQKGKCACCAKPLKGMYHLDHIMPISRGGENTERNVQLLLPQCNLSKHAKDPIDFMQSRGFLL